MADPLTARSILARSARSTPDVGSFFNSEAYKTLDADCAGALSNSAILTILLTLGGDGVQLVNWGSRTATVIGVKCEDLPPDLVQKGLAVKPLLVIEGPQEPSVLNHALQAVADFFKQHAPSSNGSGAECFPTEDKAACQLPFHHTLHAQHRYVLVQQEPVPAQALKTEQDKPSGSYLLASLNTMS
jgi:hypothetical protein